MTRLEKLEEKIRELYSAKNKDRADWADWLYENHIFQVADIAGKLAEKYGGNKELAIASALLHDIADAVMKRENPEHEEKTRETAKSLLENSDFTDEEIKIVVDDALRFHSCRDIERPQSLEGKVMAAADAVVHLQSDFYGHAKAFMGREKILEKIDRDFNNKIAFEEVRESVKPDYEKLKVNYGG